MQLSADLFAQLTGAPVPAPDAAPAGVERRQYGRLQWGKRAQIRFAERDWQTVVIRDMSVVGIGMLTEVPLLPGQTFTLRVVGTDDQPVCLQCVVHRCERGGMGGVAFFVGSTFQDACADAPVAAAGSDATSWVRRAGRRLWDRLAPAGTARRPGRRRVESPPR